MEIILFKKKYMIIKSGEQGVLVGKTIIDGKEYYIFEPDSFGNGKSDCLKVTENELSEPNYAIKKN